MSLECSCDSHHIFFREWGLQPHSNTTALLLLLPPNPATLAPSVMETWTRLAFESLNCPAFHLMPSPVAAVFGVGIASGLNVHIGRDATDITAVVDSVVRPEAAIRVNVGTQDCVTYLAEILSKDQAVQGSLKEVGEAVFGGSVEEQNLKDLTFELAAAVLKEDKPRLLVPLANGQTVPVGNEKDENDDEGVFDVAKE
jgi:actin-related protein